MNSKPGIAPSDWEKLIKILRAELPAEWFKVVNKILNALATYYI